MEDLGLGLGLWHGVWNYSERTLLRWHDRWGNVIPFPEESAQQQAGIERQRATQAEQEKQLEHQRAERLAAKLRELGLDPEQL